MNNDTIKRGLILRVQAGVSAACYDLIGRRKAATDASNAILCAMARDPELQKAMQTVIDRAAALIAERGARAWRKQP